MSEDGCNGEVLFTQNRTGNEAGFCQVLGDDTNWQEWKSMQMLTSY